jgi:uncharacterized membrane protein YdjX (TVP38/TMEM64 family)
VVTFYLTGLHERLRWESVRSQIEGWQRLADEHLLLSLTVFFAVYLTATALSLPVALVLSLVGGALFGRWVGAAVVSLASTCGASLAFLGSRYLFRDWVRRRFGGRLGVIDRGIERDGAWYLLTLRMAPYVPFFLINLGLGLTPMRLGTFALVSWLGMLPATFVIVNAGTELGRLEKPSDALSLTFVLSLALIGLLPLLVRLLLRRVNTPARASSPAPPG